MQFKEGVDAFQNLPEVSNHVLPIKPLISILWITHIRRHSIPIGRKASTGHIHSCTYVHTRAYVRL